MPTAAVAGQGSYPVAPSDGSGGGATVPFFYGSNLYVEKFATDTFQLTATGQEFTHNINPGGFLRGVRLQFERGDDFRDKNPIPQLPADEVGMLAHEAKSGALRKIAFKQRAGVHVPKRPGIGAAEIVHKGGQLLKALAEDLVVIGKLRVAGDDAGWQGSECGVGSFE